MPSFRTKIRSKFKKTPKGEADAATATNLAVMASATIVSPSPSSRIVSSDVSTVAFDTPPLTPASNRADSADASQDITQENKRSQLWKKAYGIPATKLADDELATLTDSNGTLESAIEATEDAQHEYKNNKSTYTNKDGKNVVVTNLCGQFLRGLEKYLIIGDIMVQHSPEYTALAWGTVRFIFQVQVLRYPLLAIDFILTRMHRYQPTA